MPSALDVAQYILNKHGSLTTMKLQKLVYYCQAWSVVWDDDVLFGEDIEAWRNGPVVRDLWKATQGRLKIDYVPGGNVHTLSAAQRDTVDLVLKFYGDKDAQWLSDLTHMEDPWQNAYKQGQNTTISLEEMSEYYSTIDPGDEEA